jgi:Carboxypeptidase regulatory-like domain
LINFLETTITFWICFTCKASYAAMWSSIMRTNFFRKFAGCIFAMGLSLTLASAQTVTGNITGEVTDSSGAVVPGAHVEARNLDTGVDSPGTTNAVGLFRIQFLPIGRYQLTVQAPGFVSETLPAFSLESLQTAAFNVKLRVGSTDTTVNVSAAAPILNTTDAVVASTFTANTIQNFPLNGLDFSALTLYVPGAVNTQGTSGTQSIERSTYYTDTPNVNGNRAQANNYTLDGIDMNETFNNLISYSPAPEALEEIKIVTANTPVDNGNVNGAGVFSVLKSGTNQFHGSVYGYVQDYHLNANSWTNNNQGIKINPFSQSQFGGAFGGPILRNKLFFFVDYLGARYHTGGTAGASVFTQAMRNGDFSVLLNSANPIQLYDPENNFAPYVNNQNVPIVNPVAKFLFANPKYYPLPNATPTDGIAANNYQGPSKSYKVNNQGDIKIEYDRSEADKLTGFYSMSTAYDGKTNPLLISFPGINLFPTWLLGTTWVHTFSPALINSARVGFTRTKWLLGFPLDPTGAFGTSGNSKVGINFPGQAYNGFTNQGISAPNQGGLSDVGTTADDGGLIDNTYSYIDTITWQRGHHALSFGVQALRYQNNYPTANNNGYLGTLNYTGAFTANPSAANAGGYTGADFVLDRVSSAAATLSSINVGQRQWRVAEYFNDDYQVLPNLTLNLGIRYELDQPWIEENNKTGNIDIATGQVLYAGHVPVGAPAGSGICKNRACYEWNYRQILPHIGFAYQANDRLVVRGGYGTSSFFEGNSSNQRLTSITPFIQAVNVSVPAPAPGAVTTPRTAEQGFTGGSVSYGGTFNVYPQNIQPAYVQTWNLTVQYALTHSMSLQTSYLGEQGQHIEDYGNLNQYTVNGDQNSAPYANNYYIGANGIDSALGIGTNSLLITESRAMMNYNALQVVLRQHLSHGLEYTLNYTYGRAMTNSLGNYALNVNGYSGAFQNYYNSAADYGPAGYDVRHDLSANGVYALPVGHGKQYLSSANRLVDGVLGGWQIAMAGVAYSGFPQTLLGGSNNSNSYGENRVNQYRKLKVVHRSINGWFGTDASATPCTTAGVDNGVCAFGVPAVNAFGTSSNGAVRGPGFLNVDASIFKSITVFREQAFQFRFDAFNVFNIVSYGNPDTTVTDATFGQIASQNSIRSQERRLQFSGKYSF